MAIKKVKVALIGSGMISWTYLNNMIRNFEILEVVGCSDLIEERSRQRAEEFGIRQMTNEEIFNDPEIQIVVNTTNPTSHYEVTEQALRAGKHVYTEKMIACTFEEAQRLAALAKEKNLRIGCAPDTMLSGPAQTARKLIDDGFIGEVIGVQALLVRGMRDWLPRNTEGNEWGRGGAMPMDMGAYYMHQMINMLGPVERVAGFGITRNWKMNNPMLPIYGSELISVQHTSVTGALEFKNGVIGNLTVLGEGFAETPRLEVYGTDGILTCADPNTFSGPVYLTRNGSNKKMPIPSTHDYNNYETGEPKESFIKPWLGGPPRFRECRRGLGVAEMAWAITNDRPHRCSLEVGLHSMEILYGIDQSCETNQVYTLTTSPDRPAPLPAGYYGLEAEKALDN